MHIQKLPTNRSHLLLFVKDATLLVWSKVTCELYGFEAQSAALFLYMESCKSNDCVHKAQKYFTPLSNTQTFHTLLAKIHHILTPTSQKHIIKHTPHTTQPSTANKVQKTTPFRCVFQLNDQSTFILVSSEKVLLDYVCESIEHLITIHPTASQKTFQITLQKEQEGYAIYIQGIYNRSIKNKHNLVPTLYDLIRIHHYQNHPFLIALHGAVVTQGEKAFIFPGVSGSGKSTIALYFMTHGFKLFSDELTIIDSNYGITPLPLGITLKEGSWKVASKYCVNNLEKLSIHKRFDGQNIRYIKPTDIQRKKVYPKKFFFIFPTYDKKVTTTQLTPSSLIDALQIFTISQYHLFDDKDENVVTQWIELLGKSELYTLHYSNIEEAKNIIEGLD